MDDGNSQFKSTCNCRFAHIPDGMDEVLKSFPNKDIICVGAGGNRDSAKRPLMGEVKKYQKTYYSNQR